MLFNTEVAGGVGLVFLNRVAVDSPLRMRTYSMYSSYLHIS